MRSVVAVLCASLFILSISVPPEPLAAQQNIAATSKVQPLALPDRSSLRIDAHGIITRTDARGRVSQFAMPAQVTGVHSIESTTFSNLDAARTSWQRLHGRFLPGHVVVVFRSGVPSAAIATQVARHAGSVGEAKLDAAFQSVKVTSMTPLFGANAASRMSLATQRARMNLGARALDLTQAYDVRIGAKNPIEAAKLISRSPSVVYAEPDYYVSTMLAHTGPYARSAQQHALAQSQSLRGRVAMSSSPSEELPDNYALTSSLSAFLNANNLDWVPAYELIHQKYGQIPGQGEIITNISIGDLTDPSQKFNDGSTTTLIGGQRYLDIPSMPLIPTFVSDLSSNLDPTATVSGTEDPLDGEILLDFSTMAPLPRSMQRAGRQGSALTDLLGIAPGAQYRLIVPQTQSFPNIGAAFLAAAQQQPAPNVISASLGFGTDGAGFPGRYLEDDPLLQSIIASVVAQGIVVCISANDGTRLYTNAAVNPDGGSTPTDVVPANATPTNIDDDSLSTTPSLIADSGAIDVGATTLDDSISWDPYNSGPQSALTTLAETRISGLTAYSSGFGTRVNVSAPGDAIPALAHAPCPWCTSDAVVPENAAGTSASAPEVAAAAAVVLQAARLAGKNLTPSQVRTLLSNTGRSVPTPPQIDRTLNVGPQVDIGAAVQSIIGTNLSTPSVPRVAIAMRQEYAVDGGEFEENTDPGYIDLNGLDAMGTNNFSPITIAPDWIGIPSDAHYALFATGHPSSVLATAPWARLMPEQLLKAAGQTLTSPSQRTVSFTYRASKGQHIVREATFTLTFSPSTGLTYVAPAPAVPAKVPSDQAVTVSYDLTHVGLLNAPQLIVSNIDHWSFESAPEFRVSYSTRLINLKGSVTIPASAFIGGAGLYGIAIENDSALQIAGHVAPVLVTSATPGRPDAPTLAATTADTPAHSLLIVRPQTTFSVNYDVSNVAGASGAVLEISAAGPNNFSNYNNLNNPFGNQQDHNGFDTPSTVYQPLTGVRGSVQLDAARLGLGSSMSYDVRVLASNGTSIVGTASPVSLLEYYDQSIPGGMLATGFDIEPGGASSVSSFDYYGTGSSFVYPYAAETQSYGDSWYSDTTGSTLLSVFGGDPAVKRTAVSSYNFQTGTFGIAVLDQLSGQMLGSASVPASASINDQRVNPANHSVLFISNVTGASSLIPYDLQNLQTGAAINLGGQAWSQAGAPNVLDVDRSTGTAYVMSADLGHELCGQSAISSVNVTAGTVSPSQPLGFCDFSLTSDDMGQNLYVADGRAFSEFFANTPLPNDIGEVNAQSLYFSPLRTTGGYGAITTAVDPTNKLLLVGYLGPLNGLADNTGTGRILEYSTSTGQLLKSINSFNLTYSVSGFASPEGSIQLDPSTRTGWTYGPDGTTIRQFSY